VQDQPIEKIKQIIDQTAKLKIPFIRFTGGEPLLRKDIFEILNYAKKQGLKIRLNTNSTLLTKEIITKLEKYIDYILLSYNDIKKPTTKIKQVAESKIPIVIIGTVATKENINNLEKIHEKLSKIPISGWELYRPITKEQPTKNQIKILVNKLIKLDCKYPIANAFPFCSYDKQLSSLVSLGAKYDDGHSRIVFDPRGYFKPSYFLDINLGTNLKQSWNHEFMKDLRSQKLLPEYCKTCDYKNKCLGGSRYLAKSNYNSYNTIDPLTSFQLKHLVIKPTKKCPGKCLGCSSRQDLYKNISEKMKFSDWKRVIKQAKDLGLEKLTISGGEPTLYPKIYDLIKYSKSLEITTLLNTTGLNLDPEKILESGIDGITFSLESLDPEIDKKIRGISYVPKILDTINKLKGQLSININSLITQFNYKNFYKIQNFCKENHFTWLVSYPEWDFENKHLLATKKQLSFVEKTLKIKIPKQYSEGIYSPKNCLVTTYFSLILPNGDGHPCNIVEYSHEPVVGNILNSSLKTIWEGKEYQEFRAKKKSFCKHCPVPLRIVKKS